MTELNWWTLAAGLIGAFLGAGGAVAAQIVSAIFTGKREALRLEWDKERQAGEDRKYSQGLLFEAKRIVFTKVMTLGQELTDLMSAQIRSDGGRKLTPEQLKAKMTEWRPSWQACRAELRLIDEVFDRHMRAIGVYSLTLTGDAILEDEYIGEDEEARQEECWLRTVEETATLRSLMAENLRT